MFHDIRFSFAMGTTTNQSQIVEPLLAATTDLHYEEFIFVKLYTIQTLKSPEHGFNITN